MHLMKVVSIRLFRKLVVKFWQGAPDCSHNYKDFPGAITCRFIEWVLNSHCRKEGCECKSQVNRHYRFFIGIAEKYLLSILSPSDFLNRGKDNHLFPSANPEFTSNWQIFTPIFSKPSALSSITESQWYPSC